MTAERILVAAYLLVCVGIGFWASRRALGSSDEYWVAGRRVSTPVNAMAIMAALASGGSIIGVMGLAYGRGIPYALALFAGAVVGFPIASVLVAKPLRNFGRYTITDFLAFRYPHAAVKVGAPLLILAAFTVYIVAQMKAAGITAEVLLGLPYDYAVVIAAVVFVLYVSVGGMVAVTWTDVAQGILMLSVVVGIALLVLFREGSPAALLEEAAGRGVALGGALEQPTLSYVGSFVLWATAVSVIPHIVMRVLSARDATGARLSLNLAMVAFSAMILLAVLVIVPQGAVLFPDVEDADRVFLLLVETEFPPFVRGLAVAAIMAAVMSTTDALLLACSSAVAHDLLKTALGQSVTRRMERRVVVGVAWIVGAVATTLALAPPALLTELYSAAIGLLSAGFFVPVVAGLWWKKATRLGGTAALVVGAGAYLVAEFLSPAPPLSAILFALPASALAMWAASRFVGPPPDEAVSRAVEALHRTDQPRRSRKNA